MTASFITLLGIPQAPLTPRTALEEHQLQRHRHICACFTPSFHLNRHQKYPFSVCIFGSPSGMYILNWPRIRAMYWSYIVLTLWYHQLTDYNCPTTLPILYSQKLTAQMMISFLKNPHQKHNCLTGTEEIITCLLRPILVLSHLHQNLSRWLRLAINYPVVHHWMKHG